MQMSLRRTWDRVRSSFWFVPSLLVAGAIGLAYGALALDERIGRSWAWAKSWVYTGTAEGASTMLGTIAGSMITTAGVVLSITLVALSLASSQLGPRLLRNYRRDKVNQVVIGAFLATFFYCLLVLRAIRREDPSIFVPHLSVSLSLLLALASMGVLIYFIHHLAVSIQAGEVASRVGAELLRSVERLFPEQLGEGGTGEPAGEFARTPAFAREAGRVRATDDGYLRLIDGRVLMKVATDEDLLLRVECRPGDYVFAGDVLLLVQPAERARGRVAARLEACFIIGNRRTPDQDVGFSIDQLVEVALRALSSGINDAFTAMTCLDRLGSGLCRLATRQMPLAERRDAAGKVRVVAPATTFPPLVAAAFDQIRQNCRDNPAVTMRLLETIARVGEVARRPEDRAALWRQAEMAIRGAREALPEPGDREAAEQHFREAARVLVMPADGREPGG